MTSNSRKTAYAANQHSVSIIGTDIGKKHLPGNFNPQFLEQEMEENIQNFAKPQTSDPPINVQKQRSSPEFEREADPIVDASPQPQSPKVI